MAEALLSGAIIFHVRATKRSTRCKWCGVAYGSTKSLDFWVTVGECFDNQSRIMQCNGKWRSWK